jgi:4-amino-4-deoxychorismate lyase
MAMALHSVACNGAAARSDEGTVHLQNGPQTQDSIIPVLTLSEVVTRLQEESKAGKYRAFRSMYSSVVGAITTDVAAMVIPLDDHMVHRGHSVFDTAVLINGYVENLSSSLVNILLQLVM